MSETCYYHPEAKAKANCSECTMPICDRCRLEGDMQRCANCSQFASMSDEITDGMTLPGGGGQASPEMAYAQATVAQSSDEFETPMCTNHANLAADMQCLNCFRPFCLSCASTGYCPDCAPQFVNTQRSAQMAAAAPQQDYGYEHQGAYEENGIYQDSGVYHSGLGYGDEDQTGGFDLAGSYMTDGMDRGAAPPRPKKKRPPGANGTGKLNNGKKGAPAKGGAKKKAKRGSSMMPLVGGLVVVALLGGGGYWFWTQRGGGDDAAPTGPAKVSIAAPKSSTISGIQTIKLKVASPDNVEHVDILIDGKAYGPPFKKAPFETDWPTSVGFKNGSHKLTAKAYYKGGKTVVDNKTYTIKNKAY